MKEFRVEDYYPQWIPFEADHPGKGAKCPECGSAVRLIHTGEMYADKDMAPTGDLRNTKWQSRCHNGHLLDIPDDLVQA